MKKKLISLVLAVLMALSCITIGAVNVSALDVPTVEIAKYTSRADFIQAYNSGNSVDEFSNAKQKVYKFSLDKGANVLFAALSVTDYGNSSAFSEVFTDINCSNKISLDSNDKYDAICYGYLKAGTYYLKVSNYSESDTKCLFAGQVVGNEFKMSLSFVKDNSNKSSNLSFKLSDGAVPEKLYVHTNNYGANDNFWAEDKTTFNPSNNQFAVSYADQPNACTNVRVIDENGFKYFAFARVLNKYTAKIEGSTDVAYTGKSVKLSSKNITLKAGYDAVSYTASYKNNKKIGKATVSFTGKTNCIGKYTTTFNIVPGKIKKVNAVSKTDQKTNKYKFSWSASKGATKYVIQTKEYNNGDYKTVKTTKAKSCTIKVNSSMTGASTYVQVYGIKKVNGKTYKSTPVNFWTSCNYSSFTKRYHIYVYR